jgi:hypothetical protein
MQRRAMTSRFAYRHVVKMGATISLLMGQYAFLYRELLFSIAHIETKRRVALTYV